MPVRTPKQTTQKKSDIRQIKKAITKTTKDISVDEGKASVSYTISITKNLGDYESLKIQAGITVPYGASDELLKELDELLVVSREKVTNRLSKDIDDVTTNLS